MCTSSARCDEFINLLQIHFFTVVPYRAFRMSPHLLTSQRSCVDPCPQQPVPNIEETLLSRISPHFDVKKTIYGGRGCFARSDITKGTVIHVARQPVGSSVARDFRKEVCTSCFTYQDGKTLKHRLRDKLYFCSPECTDKFMKNDPDGLLTSTLIRVESLFSVSRGEVDQDSVPSTQDEVDAIWDEVDQWIVRLDRMKPSKRALIRPVVDDDDYCELRYVIAVLHTLHQMSSNGNDLAAQLSQLRLNHQYMAEVDDSRALALEMEIFHLLQSSEEQKVQRYPYLAVTYANIYKFIRLVCPPEYLPYATPQNVRAITGRNLTNAFGIWSPLSHQDEEQEYFGFGVYPSASFFNHSCCPNVAKTRRGDVYEYRVQEDISKGTELCISYGIRASDTVETRRAALKEWFFTCGCLRCVEESGEN